MPTWEAGTSQRHHAHCHGIAHDWFQDGTLKDTLAPMAVVHAAVRPYCNAATMWPAVPEFSLIRRLGLEERYLLAGREC